MANRKKGPGRAAPALPNRVVVWCPPAIESVDRKAAAADLARDAPRLPTAEWRDEPLGGVPGAAKLAAVRIADPKVERVYLPATTADLEIELAVDARPDLIDYDHLSQRFYDGEQVAAQLLPFVPSDERSVHTLAVWVTRRLVVTYSRDDLRYHARIAVFSFPTIFSLLGLAHAPAPSLEATIFAREVSRRGYGPGQVAEALDREYPEQRLRLDDKELVARALVSSILQGAARLATGEAFCREPGCRLFNPHWRAEVQASIVRGKLCRSHAALLGRGGKRR